MQETWVPSLGGKIPWNRRRHPSPVFLPGESRGQRSLAGSMASQRVRHDWATECKQSAREALKSQTSTHEEIEFSQETGKFREITRFQRTRRTAREEHQSSCHEVRGWSSRKGQQLRLGWALREEPRKCSHKSLSGPETETRTGVSCLLQPPAFSPLPNSYPVVWKKSAFHSPSVPWSKCCHTTCSWESAEGFLGKNLLSYKRRKARGKTCQPGLPSFLPLNTCEPDGWSSGSHIVTKRQQIYTLKMAEQENAKASGLADFRATEPTLDPHPSASWWMSGKCSQGTIAYVPVV